MKDTELEKLLTKFYSEDIKPSNDLLEKTKLKIHSNRTIKYLLALSVLSNLFMLFGFIYIMVFISFNIYLKVLAVTSFTVFSNILILIIYFYRNQVESFFRKFGLENT